MDNKIEIIPYDKNWESEFLTVRKEILKVLNHSSIRIEHNGSTSVPRLSAKPIIDIQISVTNFDKLKSYVQNLKKIGYTYIPHQDDVFSAFLHKPKE